MNTIQNLFEQGQLAEAAYAKFLLFPNNPKGALEDEGFSATQATEFLKHWTVVSHQPDTANGFSATLFQRNDDDPLSGARAGDYVLAIRGSTPNSAGVDFRADGGDIFVDGIVLDQLVDTYNYWQRLTSTTYHAATLDTLSTETTALAAAYLVSPAAGLAYEATLRARSDIVIDYPSRAVRTIHFEAAARTDGLGQSITAVDVTGHIVWAATWQWHLPHYSRGWMCKRPVSTAWASAPIATSPTCSACWAEAQTLMRPGSRTSMVWPARNSRHRTPSCYPNPEAMTASTSKAAGWVLGAATAWKILLPDSARHCPDASWILSLATGKAKEVMTQPAGD